LVSRRLDAFPGLRHLVKVVVLIMVASRLLSLFVGTAMFRPSLRLVRLLSILGGRQSDTVVVAFVVMFLPMRGYRSPRRIVSSSTVVRSFFFMVYGEVPVRRRQLFGLSLG